MRAQDRGSATVWVLVTGLVFVIVAGAVALVGSATAARHRARSAADLARLLGYSPSTALRLGAPACVSLPAVPAPGDAESQPEVRVARARLEAARGSVEAALAARVPSLEPQVGLRRTGGRTGLYIGVAASLPFVDRSSGRVAAARAEETAVMAEQREVEERLTAARAGARRALEAFERAGTRFDATWFESLERTVTAATAVSPVRRA